VSVRRLVVFVVAALALAPAAYAANTVLAFSITTGSPLTGPAITLTGDDQTATFTIVTQIQYAGNAQQAALGWTVKANATQPTNGTTTLPALQVTAGSFACASSCTANPDNPVATSYPITLTGSPQTIYNASPLAGRGNFNVTSTYKLSYPGGATKGTYTATITLTGSTPGP
jgi:hypothetical protein